ncbi:MAG TPA: hypothetical protein VL131_02445 [Gammaproteobacteria bacterium]|nr:hypothetical protein [Gammaproteobacteria bacterium]
MRPKFAVLAACAALALAGAAFAQQPSQPQPQQRVFTFKAAVVALTDDPKLRESFERQLVAKAREHRYDAVTSYDLVPKVADVRSKSFIKTLAAKDVKVVLMVRPAAIGAGSSLDAVKDEVSPAMLQDMKSFAKAVSPPGGTDLIAVVHLAIYAIDTGKPELLSPGAVWLDEPVTDRAEGIARLQDLIVKNVDAARPALRQYLGMPPLPPPP